MGLHSCVGREHIEPRFTLEITSRCCDTESEKKTSASKSSRVIRIGPGYEDPSPSRGCRRDPRQAERGVLETGVSESVRR